MPTDSTSTPDDRRAALSALMDGQPDGCEQACRAWRADAGLRADWHVWHVIGDLMRSDEHGADAARDARLLQRVREQLAREPVVLAPGPAAAPAPARLEGRRRLHPWMAPTAVAAGFVAVAGVLLATRAPAPDASDRAGVTAATGAVPVAQVSPKAAAPEPAAEASTATEGVRMIRSAELDRYLAAHRQYANGALQVAPGGAVRQAAVAAPGR